MAEKMTNREKLNREIKALDDDQVLEVLEYITIMKSMRDQEVNLSRFKGGVSASRSSPEDSPHRPILGNQEGDVVIFPRWRRAASK